MQIYFETDMNCPQCFNATIDAVSKLDGVEEVDGHLAGGCLSVRHSGDEATIRKVIASTGRTIEVASNGETVMGQAEAHVRSECGHRP